MINVEVFTAPGCGKCGRAKQVLQQVVASLAGVTWREVNILDEMDYAARLGVLSTPAMAIDGELVFSALPSEKRLRQTLTERLGEKTA